MSSPLEGLFGSSGVGKQLFIWGFLQQVILAMADPAFTDLLHASRSAAMVEALSPADAATAVNRGFWTPDQGATEASLAGVAKSRFQVMTDLAGEAPGPEALAEALRRGIIALDASTGGLPSFNDGIRQGNLRDVWAPLFHQLSVQLPSWSDALDALLEGQLDEASSREWFAKAGGDLDAFTWLFDTRGTSPTPDMLATMANRGIIPWVGTGPTETTYAQGFLEGPWRNKWEPAMRALAAYLPPPRTVTTLIHEDAITDAQALALFEKEGLSAELAGAYVAGAHHTATSTQKQLTAAQIEALVADHVLTDTQASAMLATLGYDPATAKLIVTGAELKRSIASTNSAITRVRTLYTARKITREAATSTLTKLGVDPGAVSDLLTVWDLEAAATVKQLTEAQIAGAFTYAIIDQTVAQAELEAIGYQPWDAWVVLSVRAKGPLPDEPPRTPGPVAVV